MPITTYTGLRGYAYTLYLLVYGLNATSLWFVCRKVAWSLFPKAFSKPTHSEFLATLLTYLRPVISVEGTTPQEMGRDDKGEARGYIVLCNHVNWSDFVIDIVFVERGVYVSRNVLKAVFFPGSYLRKWLFDDMIYFSRGPKSATAQSAAKTYLYDSVEAKCREGRSVIVYAEGTRNPEGKRMPLRVGLIKLAYDRRIPLYVSMTSDKFHILDERKGRVSLGVPIRNKKSPVLEPADFKTLDDFIQARVGEMSRANFPPGPFRRFGGGKWEASWTRLIAGKMSTMDGASHLKTAR